ncbi:MAG TPA: hypothetical protein PLI43_00480 [Albidovulum sp.]|uniref:hypothetical protein n=1 Tax=Albidovulum sp. TaxID=1872424 RepID=UPI002CE133CB|nr:hypothetical protein [Albidovulum sp.]
MSGYDHGPAVYLTLMSRTAVIAAALTAFMAAGPLGLIVGIPFMLLALLIGWPMAALFGLPIWFATWRVGLRLGWSADAIGVFAALLIGLAWSGLINIIVMHLPSRQPRGYGAPILLPGKLEVMLGAMAQSSYIVTIVALFVAMHYYSGAKRG